MIGEKVYCESSILHNLNYFTLPKTNIGPEINGWKTKSPFGMAYFQRLC